MLRTYRCLLHRPRPGLIIAEAKTAASPRLQGSEFSVALTSARHLPEVLLQQGKPSAPCGNLEQSNHKQHAHAPWPSMLNLEGFEFGDWD